MFKSLALACVAATALGLKTQTLLERQGLSIANISAAHPLQLADIGSSNRFERMSPEDFKDLYKLWDEIANSGRRDLNNLITAIDYLLRKVLRKLPEDENGKISRQELLDKMEWLHKYDYDHAYRIISTFCDILDTNDDFLFEKGWIEA